MSSTNVSKLLEQLKPVLEMIASKFPQTIIKLTEVLHEQKDNVSVINKIIEDVLKLHSVANDAKNAIKTGRKHVDNLVKHFNSLSNKSNTTAKPMSGGAKKKSMRKKASKKGSKKASKKRSKKASKK